MNAGILSACLPTLRPIFRAYPVTSLLSRLIKSFTSSFRSTLRPSKTDIRLNSLENSMEKGLNESHREEALGVPQNMAKAMYDSSHTPPRSPTAIHYQSTYSVSDHPHLGRSGDDS